MNACVTRVLSKPCRKQYKCSAVAEMGDGLAIKDMGRREEDCCAPFEKGELGPHLTQCGLGQGLPRTKWHLDTSSHLAKIDMGRKVRSAVPLFRGAGSPSNTLWSGPRAYLRVKFHFDPSNRLPHYTNVSDRTYRQSDRQHCANCFTNGRPKINQKFTQSSAVRCSKNRERPVG